MFYHNLVVLLQIDCFSRLVFILGLDGYVARKFNQTSAFGAWFDVVIDIISRGMLWSNVYSVSVTFRQLIDIPVVLLLINQVFSDTRR